MMRAPRRRRLDAFVLGCACPNATAASVMYNDHASDCGARRTAFPNRGGRALVARPATYHMTQTLGRPPHTTDQVVARAPAAEQPLRPGAASAPAPTPKPKTEKRRASPSPAKQLVPPAQQMPRSQAGLIALTENTQA